MSCISIDPRKLQPTFDGTRFITRAVVPHTNWQIIQIVDFLVLLCWQLGLHEITALLVVSFYLRLLPAASDAHKGRGPTS